MLDYSDIKKESEQEEKKDFMSKVKEITGDVLKNSGLMDKMQKQMEKISGPSNCEIEITGTSFKGDMVKVTSNNQKEAVKVFVDAIKNLEKEGR